MAIDLDSVKTVLYKAGDTRLYSLINPETGNELYTGKTVDECIEEKPGLKEVSFDYALKEIEKAENEKYLSKGWHEITKDEYWDYLECLPPEKWQTCNGIEIFRMSEYMTSDITQHCVKYKDRYFAGLKRTTTDYTDIAKEIIALCD